MLKRHLIICSLCLLPCLIQARPTVPARDYFQQDVRYTINVILDDSTHRLRGEETLLYRNNSPDTLHFLYFHLWPNAYRDDQTVLAKTYYNDNDMRFIRAGRKGRGWIDSLDFTVDGERINWQLLIDTPDVAVLELKRPLAPGDSLNLHTPFVMKYPSAGISRLGHSGQAYYTTQWYPKPAVYDRNGWNYFPYVDKGEYYGEFGSFDVSITLPENYRVGATGLLMDGEKEYAWLDSLSEATTRTDSFNTRQLSFPSSSPVFKTLHYRQDRVHDFAFFADKRWNVLKRDMLLPASGRKVSLYAFFTNHQANWWRKAPEYMERAVKDYSRWVGEYPYDAVTAVDVIYAEGADMEYPMITAIGAASNAYQLDAVLAHEIGHNWFYGILGSNERLHPWQDEGVNSFTDRRYLFTEYAADSASMNEYFNRLGRWGKWTGNTRMDGRLKQYYRYLADARLNIDQPLTLRSEEYTLRNYSDMVYAKTSLGFQYLFRYLGDSLFDACMHQYYDEWSFRHPEPDDMEEVFERVSGRQLDWMFDDWLKTTDKLDYAVKSITATSDSFDLTLRNKGSIEGPVGIAYTDTTGKKATYWTEGFSKDTTVRIHGQPFQTRVIDADLWMPERDRKNNSIRSSGLFRKTAPLQLKLLTGMEHSDRTRLYLAPALGWNYSNGLMGGCVFHNIGYPQKDLEFAVMPLFAAGSLDAAGGGYVSYRIHPERGVFREIRIRSGIQRYAYDNPRFYSTTIDYASAPSLHFLRLENSATFSLKNKHPRNRIASEFTLRSILLDVEELNHGTLDVLNKQRNYIQAGFRTEKQDKWTGYDFSATATVNDHLLRIWVSASDKLPYQNPEKGIHLSFGAGYVSYDGVSDYRFRLSGWDGNEDFLFDEVFADRGGQTSLFGQQFTAMDGGFATPTSYFRLAERWMTALHLKADIPGKLPLRFFINLATFDQPSLSYNRNSRLSYEGGIEIDILPDVFTVYLPLSYSDDIRYAVEQQDLDFVQRIRFEFHLKKLNPLEKLNR